MSQTEAEIAQQAADDAAAALARGDVLPEEIDDTAEKAAAAAKEAEEAAAAAKTADELANADETAETDAEKAEREAEEAAAATKKRVRIPLERHEEILAKARQREEALAAQLVELQRTAAAPAQKQRDALGEMKGKIDELQDKYEELVFEGKKDEAKPVRAQLEALRETYIDTKTALSSDHARRQTIDDLKYESTLAKAEADYPALNPDNADTFEAAKATEVAQLLEMFQKNGLTRQAALEKAVKYVMGPPAAKEEAGKDTTAATLAAQRAQAAREKALEAQRRQPPDTSVTGTDNDKAGKTGKGGIDVMKLSQEKFAQLDEATLSQMRGDTL